MAEMSFVPCFNVSNQKVTHCKLKERFSHRRGSCRKLHGKEVGKEARIKGNQPVKDQARTEVKGKAKVNLKEYVGRATS
jgi:hypothetical protein